MAPNSDQASGENPYFAPAVVPSRSPRPSTAGTTASTSNEPHTPVGEGVPGITATSTRPRPPALTPSTRPSYHGAQRQQSSIGLRRLRAPQSRLTLADNRRRQPTPDDGSDDAPNDGRRRSSSAPQRPTWLAPATTSAQQGERRPSASTQGEHLDTVPETAATPSTDEPPKEIRRKKSWLWRLPTRQRIKEDEKSHPEPEPEREYDSRTVDLLDVVDPEVSTLTSITNVQNSLFVPSLGRLVNRRPTYDVTAHPPHLPGTYPQSHHSLENVTEEPRSPDGDEERPATARRFASYTSNVVDTHYAVLPHGESLDGWTQEEVDMLNDHVRHMLHSRRNQFKRSMQGFGRYVRTPLGFAVTLYATLITLFGLAWVLFLIGWIYVGEQQSYAIKIIDWTLVALFGIVGDGMAPFRAVDTYHMIYIAHYHHHSWRLRKKLQLPELPDHNDLPTEAVLPDLETGDHAASVAPLEAVEVANPEDISVLTVRQQEKLIHHQTKYSKSHTFYRPHETETHYAFPLRLLVAVTVLLDVHSLLQITLGLSTYAVPSHKKPPALTTVVLCCSIADNICAGLLIWIGDKRTRKKDVAERMMRQELTEEAMRKVRKDREREAEEAERKRQQDKEDEEAIARGEEPPHAGGGGGGGRKSLTLPRMSLDKSLDKVTSKATEKVAAIAGGESSSSVPKRSSKTTSKDSSDFNKLRPSVTEEKEEERS